MRIPLLTSLVLVVTLSPSAGATPPPGGATDGAPPNLPVDTRCSLLTSSPVIDYGTLSRWQLQEASGGRNRLTPGKRTLMVSVACPHRQAMQLTLRGDRATNGDLRYGDRGSMTVRLQEAQLDGKSIQVARTTSAGAIDESPTDTLSLQPGQALAAAAANGRLAKGKAFTARFEIEPTLPESDARVSRRQTSESRFTLELMH